MPKADTIRARYAEAFTIYERDVIEECITLGHFNHVVSVLDTRGLTVFTPEKEKILNDYLDLRRPVTIDSDSPTRQELEKMAIDGDRIETPEQEAEFQARLDAEKAEKEAALKAKLEARESDEGETEEDPRLSMKKPELIAALTEKGIEFKATQSKADLLALLIASETEETDSEEEETEEEA